MDLGIQQRQARAADETDRPWGEAVKAVVEPNAGFKIDPAEIITFCRETLGGVKTPKTVEVWDLLPRNANGKVLKRQIRDQFWLGRRRAV
jgi:acyl-CoA synthetase (AMP-forming)/AMP-acid ligase II